MAISTAAAILGGSAISAIAGSKASKKAAKTQAAAADAGIAEQRRQFDLVRQDQQPWMTAGTAALNRLQDPTAFTASPGYDFRRSEGTRDINNSFAARGGALSGNALKALSEFNQNIASSEYGNWWNQQAGLAGVGQAATNAVGQAGLQTGNNIANLLGNAGAARASGIQGQANAIQGGLSDLAGIYGYYKGGGFGGPSMGTPPIWSGNPVFTPPYFPSVRLG
jgi:hypothetical protein